MVDLYTVNMDDWKLKAWVVVNLTCSYLRIRDHHHIYLAEAMVTPRRKCRRPAMVTPKSYPYP